MCRVDGDLEPGAERGDGPEDEVVGVSPGQGDTEAAEALLVPAEEVDPPQAEDEQQAADGQGEQADVDPDRDRAAERVGDAEEPRPAR